MKKFTLAIVFSLLCLFVPGLLFCEVIPPKEAKVLVVYYSRTGHTQLVAEKLAKKFNADIERLIDQKKRTGPLGFLAAGKDAIASNTTQIAVLEHRLNDYDIILIGGPSWYSNVTPAIRAFITQSDLSAKKVGLFGLCHLTGVENALKQAADLIVTDGHKKFPTLMLREKELEDSALTKKIDAFYQVIQETK